MGLSGSTQGSGTVCERGEQVSEELNRGTDNQTSVDVGLSAGAKESKNSLKD